MYKRIEFRFLPHSFHLLAPFNMPIFESAPFSLPPFLFSIYCHRFTITRMCLDLDDEKKKIK